MRYIDPHIHMVSRTTDDYERMALAGCVAITEPAFWAGFDRSSAAGFFDYFTHLTTQEPARAATYGIAHHTWICINPKEGEDVGFAREVIGIIPHGLIAMEVAHDGLSELHAVHSMHERKAMMEQLADAFVTLPGGYGTHDETFEALAWLQLGIHRKPIALLNTLGYYDDLLAYLDHTVREGFLAPANRELLLVENEADALLDTLAAWTPPDIPRWVPTLDEHRGRAD